MKHERSFQTHGNETGFDRREFLKGSVAAGVACGSLRMGDYFAHGADEIKKQGKACILLWMQGGPSQFETFDPKPGHKNGGETKAIDTSVSGVKISEFYTETAKIMNDVTLIRSMTTREGNHQRASFLLHTGYLPTAGIKYPSFGSIVYRDASRPESELPGFVRIGGNIPNSGGGGFLGVDYDPFLMPNAGQLPQNVKPTTPEDRYRRRLDLLSQVDAGYEMAGGRKETEDHKKLYSKASRMVLSPRMKTFDISQEPQAVRDRYGNTPFASGCLLARRLVESGVPFVEVTLNGWDTHANNYNQVKNLSGQVDRPMAALIGDLKERGMLENTLVVWMGEFGRTPNINPRAGRDHYPKAFSVLTAGGGIKGGKVIGSTNEGGTEVADRPVSVQDLLRTFCSALNIDANKENMSPIGRPIKVVDGGNVISEMFS